MLVNGLHGFCCGDVRTEEDGEETDVLLSWLGDRLRKDLALLVDVCIDE
jgi:hypothetical protein